MAYERSLRHYRDNKKKCDQRSLEWAKSRGRPAIKAWKQRNPEKVKEQGRIDQARRLANPVSRAKVYDNGAKRRARLAGVTVEKVHRVEVFEAHGWICALCDQPVDPKAARRADIATIDHIIPITKGGEHSMSNVQLAHLSCNIKKGNKLPGGI